MQLQNKLRQYNHQWQLRLLKMAENSRSDCSSGSQRLPQLRFGIGIHGGEAVAGMIGAGVLSTQVKGKAEPLQTCYVEPSAQPSRPSIACPRRPGA